MQTNIINTSGKKSGTVKLNDQLFGANISPKLIAQYIRVFRSRNRSNTKKVKTRGEITGSTAKIWRQKGTGRARHGARSAPIFVAGGVAHGPKGEENFKLKVSKKTRRLALKGALSSKIDDVVVASGLNTLDAKTTSLAKALEKITKTRGKKTLIILDKPLKPLIQAASNIKNITTTQAKRLNPYEVLNHHHLIFTKSSLVTLDQTFLKSPSQPTKTTKTKKTSRTATNKK